MMALVLIALAVIAAYGLYYLFPDQSRYWFDRARAARKTIFGIVAALVGFAFIASGYLPLVIVGFLMWVYIGLYFLLENPHEVLLG